MNDFLTHRNMTWTSCKDHCKKNLDLERASLRLKPIKMNTLAFNKQMQIVNPYVLPASMLSIMQEAESNPNVTTWGLFSDVTI